jgi:hypothetical protein
MILEDTFPDRFKKNAYHPSAFIYAWKAKELEKLFEELMQSNIAIKNGEVWAVYRDRIDMTIQLKTGQIQVFEWTNEQKEDEQWYDFVERSCKESLDTIGYWDLEKNVRPDLVKRIWYHFEFKEND